MKFWVGNALCDGVAGELFWPCLEGVAGELFWPCLEGVAGELSGTLLLVCGSDCEI